MKPRAIAVIDAQMPALLAKEAALLIDLSTVRGAIAALEQLKRDVMAGKGTRVSRKAKHQAAAKAIMANWDKQLKAGMSTGVQARMEAEAGIKDMRDAAEQGAKAPAEVVKG